jgi:hypothetical protein
LIIPFAFFLACEARADPAAQADLLFQGGIRFLQAGHFAEACPKLAESQKLDLALGTLLHLAACHERLGLTASAWSEFSSATDWVKRTNQPARAAFGRKHMTQLESTLASVVIRASQVPRIRAVGGRRCGTEGGGPIDDPRTERFDPPRGNRASRPLLSTMAKAR